MHKTSTSALNFLWVIDFEYRQRLHHGALLRYFNFAPELLAQGHTVTFAVNFLDADRAPSIEYLQELKTRGAFSDFVEATLQIPLSRIRVAAQLIYPGLSNHVLRAFQAKYAARIDELAQERQADVILISSPRCFFLPQASRSGRPFVYDVCDSQALQCRRQLQVLLKKQDVSGLARSLKPAILAHAREHYYGGKPVTKIMVSPVDKRALDNISGAPETSVVVMNGVRQNSDVEQISTIPGRIIFTGNMDFPPNNEAALWFLEQAFPLLLRERPDARLVIAGANPLPELQKYSAKNVQITGYVEDLNSEIACSEIFIAPLVSGGGFKNKIMEAIVNRTPVVATSIAVEFLDRELRDLVLVADSPENFVKAILKVWENPGEAKARAENLRKLVIAQFGWAQRASEIVELARRVIANRN